MDETARLYRRLAALQGVELAEERAETVAELLRRQLAAEGEATRALAFEAEPSSFARTLDGGSR
jgi:hypothetical protein